MKWLTLSSLLLESSLRTFSAAGAQEATWFSLAFSVMLTAAPLATWVADRCLTRDMADCLFHPRLND